MHFDQPKKTGARVRPAARRYDSTRRAYWRDMYFVKKFGRTW